MSFTSRPATLAGRVVLAALLLAAAACFGAAESSDDLLHHADQIKTADNSAFQELLKQLDADAEHLSTLQHDYLDYLKAWQAAYEGDYQASESALKSVLGRTQDPTLRARARISLLNDQALASHYEDAYTNLSELLDSLPAIKDRTARNFSLGVAALLYNQAGQYDLALKYADLYLAVGDDSAICKAMSQKVESLYKLGRLHADDAQIQNGINACQKIGDALFANLIRLWPAQVLIDQGNTAEALKLLDPHDAEMLKTHAASSISQFRSLLARCYLLSGELARAQELAQSAIDHGIKESYSKPVADAYEVLYEAAKREGNLQQALAWHEKYSAADKGYLNDTRSRALAYQMVHQHVLDKKREIEALSERNRTLELRQVVDAKTAENRLLYIGMLVMGLGLVATWAYRTKRSQLKFQKLARRDGLTGIFNRQHFLESAQEALRYCAKDAREASLLVMDLDHFKTVNDMHGHATGDAALKRAVSACQSRLRSIDLFGRLGGEEFAILLPDCAENPAAHRADEMREAIAASRRSGDAAADVVVTASFGVASTHACGYNLTTLLANADSALYAAKHAGRNRVATYQVATAGTVSAA